MKKVLIFSGTYEGHELARRLSGAGVAASVCVATEYGEEVMEPLPGVTISKGRLDAEGMAGLMKSEDFVAVVDATHPYAIEASENIKKSAGECGLTYLRLKRDTSDPEEPSEDIRYFSSNEECEAALCKTEGNILLTTGSKELGFYCAGDARGDRIYARVLPAEENIAACKSFGLSGKQIIAMQGPFSAEMNLALMRQLDIKHMVTKKTGSAGGFPEKLLAAKKAGVKTYVIKNPEKEEGLAGGDVVSELERICGVKIAPEPKVCISLIGTGMGDIGTLTLGAKEAIARADIIFGAGRLLDDLDTWNIKKSSAKTYPYYLAKDIIPVIRENAGASGSTYAAVLLSGDSGFYSGCVNLYKKLNEWRQGVKSNVSVKIYPGISSVSYFAASCGVSWDDARLLSTHGKGARKDWEAEVLSAVKYEKKIIIIVSGAEDVKGIGEILSENGMGKESVTLGYRLSYPDERIIDCTAEDCKNITEDGLYIVGIFKETKDRRYLAPHISDDQFIRGSVPMTKEEIRELAVCKLHLTPESVVYDIGSGTGSVAVEIASRSEKIKVFAIEKNPEAIELIKENRRKFGVPNIEVIEGTAPDCMEGLPAPTHAFIGGSSGNLKEILASLRTKTPGMRVVISAVSMETTGEIARLSEERLISEEEIILVQISRSHAAGSHHLMRAENPIYLCSFTLGGEKIS